MLKFFSNRMLYKMVDSFSPCVFNIREKYVAVEGEERKLITNISQTETLN